MKNAKPISHVTEDKAHPIKDHGMKIRHNRTVVGHEVGAGWEHVRRESKRLHNIWLKAIRARGINILENYQNENH